MERSLIMVVDDESKIRRIVAQHLEHCGYDVMSAGDGEEALEAFEKAPIKPELVILDVMMPSMDGFECAKRLLRIDPSLPIIFLSAKSEPTSKVEGFEIGAEDYLSKPFSLDELTARVKVVFRHVKNTASAFSAQAEEMRNGPLSICPIRRTCSVYDKEIHLADTEFRLLLTLMKNPGVVLTHEHLLRSVWGAEAIGELQYLRVCFARIRRKLEEAGLEGGVISSYSRVGYILRDLERDPL